MYETKVKKQWIICEKIGYICLSLTGGKGITFSMMLAYCRLYLL